MIILKDCLKTIFIKYMKKLTLLEMKMKLFWLWESRLKKVSFKSGKLQPSIFPLSKLICFHELPAEAMQCILQ